MIQESSALTKMSKKTNATLPACQHCRIHLTYLCFMLPHTSLISSLSYNNTRFWVKMLFYEIPYSNISTNTFKLLKEGINFLKTCQDTELTQFYMGVFSVTSLPHSLFHWWRVARHVEILHLRVSWSRKIFADVRQLKMCRRINCWCQIWRWNAPLQPISHTSEALSIG